MNFYKLRHYIQYRMKAKGRHGVHSPFVYDFIDHGLSNKLPKGIKDNAETRVERYFKAGNRIAATEEPDKYYYFEKKATQDGVGDVWQREDNKKGAITRFLKKQIAEPEFRIDQLILVAELYPKYLPKVFCKFRPLLHSEGMCIIHQIHQSPAMTAAWDELRHEASVTLSIDLFSLGLLFFNPGIKERQHFVLRCKQ